MWMSCRAKYGMWNKMLHFALKLIPLMPKSYSCRIKYCIPGDRHGRDTIMVTLVRNAGQQPSWGHIFYPGPHPTAGATPRLPWPSLIRVKNIPKNKRGIPRRNSTRVVVISYKCFSWPMSPRFVCAWWCQKQLGPPQSPQATLRPWASKSNPGSEKVISGKWLITMLWGPITLEGLCVPKQFWESSLPTPTPVMMIR